MSEFNPMAELERLRACAREVIAALQSQHELLRKRGMGLPPGMLQGVSQVEADLSSLEQQLQGEQTELSQLRALTETTALINSSLDLEIVLARAMDEVIRLTGAERGYLVLLDPADQSLEVRVVRDLENPQAGPEFRGSTTILQEVLATGQPLRTDNAYKDPRMQDHVSIAQLTLRSVVCVPLTYKGTVIGALYVDNRLRTGVFTAREETLLVAFANQAAVAIENARLFARVQAILAETTAIKELMANVFDSIGSGVITADAADQVTTFNPAAGEILGIAPEAAIGQPLAAVLPRISPDFPDHLHRVRERSQSEKLETELDVAARGRRVLSFNLSPLKDPQGRTQGVAIVLDDLTEQREREDKLNILRRYLPPALVENVHQIAQLALGGERREVTCLFVEVRPLATFPPDLRPGQVMEMLNAYFTVATDCIHDHNGVIDKYMGTELMALFNSQLNPMGNHALMAVQAALALREAFVAYYARQGLPPDTHFYRAGLHTGVATLGNVGSLSRRDFTALGDTINLAHRLLENAQPGQLIMSEATAQVIQIAPGRWPASIVCQPREPVKAKGRQQATPVYEVFKAE